jgi:hypothetical protein
LEEAGIISSGNGKTCRFFAGLLLPVARDIPQRAIGFGKGCVAAEAEVAQNMIIQGRESLTLAMNGKGGAETRPQAALGCLAARPDGAGGKGGGVERGEHGLSFQGLSAGVMQWRGAIRSLDISTRIAHILKMNGFYIWHQGM